MKPFKTLLIKHYHYYIIMLYLNVIIFAVAYPLNWNGDVVYLIKKLF
jgi:hypothetical protein